ncbi:chemotaxis protein CheC [Shewanella eurypsychrophilus]|uniref:Chemotaxis protein CheC n=1 Tax=Shewanella eurypsychrophilus TaxID=2593656 RepID=A0ABX6V2U5_9GAMM|nr:MULTISPECIES: chemotaxis protein CheC [Shewanella]QFU21323.1 chemotaxis protein CheC [Shewanella sp. YLB-09]QPG56613.1 chemotaxis protein CheC [Shewanella eurypsychrophilus]
MSSVPVSLTEMQQDALAELFNLGIGHAASLLSEMIQDKVELTTPKAEIVPLAKASKLLFEANEKEISAVEQSFEGGIDGVAMLVFPQSDSLELVRQILKTNLPAEELSELESDALIEVGNIILNSCFGCISDALQTPFQSSLPTHIQGSAEELFGEVSKISCSDYVLMLYMQFDLPNHQVTGCVNFFMSLSSLVIFIKSVDDYLKRMMNL